jgi:hypothetical protein
MGSFKALLFRALKPPIPVAHTGPVKFTVPKFADRLLNFLQGRVQIGNQIIGVLDAD